MLLKPPKPNINPVKARGLKKTKIKFNPLNNRKISDMLSSPHGCEQPSVAKTVKTKTVTSSDMLSRPYGCEQPSVAKTVTSRVETLKILSPLPPVHSTEQCLVTPECDSSGLVPLRSDGSGGSDLPAVSIAAHSSQELPAPSLACKKVAQNVNLLKTKNLEGNPKLK